MFQRLQRIPIEDLIQDCRHGKRRAQQEVYRRYHRAMYNTALRIVGDEWEAEDLMQEGFVDAFTKLDLFRGDATFGSWLKRIVINRCLNHLKARQRRPFQVGLEGMDLEQEEEEEIPLRESLSLTPARVSTALQQLPEGYRSILSLYLLEGYDHEEIAQIMEISPGTSRSQYARAKQKLRKLIENTQPSMSGS